MRRLTLVLSDLYLPEDPAGTELPKTPGLPVFESLLRGAQSSTIGDWRRWVLARHEPGPRENLAGWCAASVGLPASAWLATPVHLEARLDHVRLSDRGLLQIPAAERDAWCAEFRQVFGPQYGLHACGSRAFLLTGLGTTEALTPDPARVLGAEIGPFLPRADAPEVRRLWAEIEMWLHGSATNAGRERARRPRLSALWLWGREKWREDSPTQRGEEPAHWFGRDPVFECMARRGGASARSAATWSDVPDTARAMIVEIAPLTGDTAESLSSLDANWFTPARIALGQGKLDELAVIANDRCFRIGRRSHLRFWRRRRRWLDRLAAKA